MFKRSKRKEVNVSDIIWEPIQTRSRSRTTALKTRKEIQPDTDVMGSAGFYTRNDESVATLNKETKKKLEKDKINQLILVTQPPARTKPQREPTPLDAGDVKKCPTCSSVLGVIQGTEWQSTPVVWCPICPAKPFLCGTCLFPWQGPPGVLGHCANKRCAVVGTLLTCGLITDPGSKVRGCPEFRACPKCYNLLMHSHGCKYMFCTQCLHRFCYICLRDSKVCQKNKDMYWSLTCSKPRAGRQRFST